MNRAAEFLNSLVVPTPLRGAIRNYLVHKRSGYQEIGSEPETGCWIKLVIYLGTALSVILSTVAFANGYVIIPAISSSVCVVCAVLFWFRNSTVFEKFAEWSRTVFCFPCNYFKRPPSPDAETERRLRQLLFGGSVEAQTDGAEVQPEAQIPLSVASSLCGNSINMDPEPAKTDGDTEL